MNMKEKLNQLVDIQKDIFEYFNYGGLSYEICDMTSYCWLLHDYSIQYSPKDQWDGEGMYSSDLYRDSFIEKQDFSLAVLNDGCGYISIGIFDNIKRMSNES